MTMMAGKRRQDLVKNCFRNVTGGEDKLSSMIYVFDWKMTNFRIIGASEINLESFFRRRDRHWLQRSFLLK